MGDYHIDWNSWRQPANHLVYGFHATGERISSYYGRKFIEKFVFTCVDDMLTNVNDDFNSDIKLRSLDIERSSIVCYFELSDSREEVVFNEDVRPALLLLFARIGEALKSGEMPGYVLAGIRERHQNALAWNH